nr:HAD-IC family P-type ATPase [Clostridiales bacterium]
MKCVILHESKSRLRIHACLGRMTLSQADILECYLKETDGVDDVKVYDRTCDAVIVFSCGRDRITEALSSFSFEEAKKSVSVPGHSSRAMEREFEDRLFFTVAFHYLKRWILPYPVRAVITAVKSAKYIYRGLKELVRGRITVPVLDAAAISVSMLRGDFGTSSSVMFLLKIGDILDDWTHKKAVDDLARTMALNVEKVWKREENGDVLADVRDIKKGDLIVVRTGGLIPLDGTVAGGEATVNQSSLTGESEPAAKREGGAVYAGTAVDEGELLIKVTNVSGSGRYDQIVRMIEESEKLKSSAEARSSHIADGLVPYSFIGTALVWLLTKNASKALSVLMVDFSCALKLSMPVAVLSAMKECGQMGITVKSGKALEAAAEAATVVFDKTGTLTEAAPAVKKIYTFGDENEDECLRLAACLEEHFPHSIASAVVNAAKSRGLRHEERHAKVEYVVAHGVVSSVDGVRCVIGSYHFVFEDEGCVIPDGKRE